MQTEHSADSTSGRSEQLQMMELHRQGFHCSDIMLFMGLESQGKANADVIRTVSPLAGGLGFSGSVCGALTGATCLLGLYAGRGVVGEASDPKLEIMVQELVDWFTEEYGTLYGGVMCREITLDDPSIQPTRCPYIVWGAYQKAKSLLVENGFYWGRESEQIPSADETLVESA